MDFIDTPFLRLIVMPFLAAAILAGIIRWIAGEAIGKPLAGAAVGVVFMWSAATILGVPDFPPTLDAGSTIYVLLLGLIAGIALDVIDGLTDVPIRPYQIGATILYGAIVSLWLEPGISIVSIVAFIVWIMLALRLLRHGSTLIHGPVTQTVILIMAIVGLVVMAAIAGTDTELSLSLALTAALAGFLLWAWPPSDFPVGMTLLLTAGGGFLAITLRLADSWPAAIAAIALLSFLFFADTAVRRVVDRPVLLSRALFPVTVAGFTLLPIVLAAVIFFILINLPEG